MGWKYLPTPKPLKVDDDIMYHVLVHLFIYSLLLYTSLTDRSIIVLKRKYHHFDGYFVKMMLCFSHGVRLSSHFLNWCIFQITSMIGSDTVLDAMGQIEDDTSETGVVTRIYVSSSVWCVRKGLSPIRPNDPKMTEWPPKYATERETTIL